ncbi:helical backbone metal receptor [Sabulilitoribacter arenilitoris]|uniref:Helical backbone metal receptor n=1 Tax=Wocania arenilitoris TaxID=2044858 RepID=A0AAE3JLQ3_9FLAO|nr:helical backbone metal receptor [Wocania arenilitoris]MCF7568462.1 helical backbone metal receptor [Wocania arenilitoris]
MTKQIQDQLNRKLYLKNTPKRIVSLVPSQTELLVDLGLETSIVGVTKFCVHPIHLKKSKTIVGGTKHINIDKIQSLNPDIILCNKEENTKEIVEACQKICSTHVSDIFNIEDSLQLISQYGSLFDKKEEALKIVNKIQKEADDFKTFIQKKPILKVVYFIWKNPWMVAANSTFINYVLGLNNFENVYETKTRYPEIELNNSTIYKDVDVVLLSSEPFPFKNLHKKELQTFYPNATIELVDGEMFSWYGSRLTKVFTYFKNLRLNLEAFQAL